MARGQGAGGKTVALRQINWIIYFLEVPQTFAPFHTSSHAEANSLRKLGNLHILDNYIDLIVTANLSAIPATQFSSCLV